MSPLELMKMTTVIPQNCNVVEAQNKHHKIAFTNIIDIIKDKYIS